MSHDSKSVRTITRHSINKAIELIAKDSIKKKRRRVTEETTGDHKIALHCNNSQGNRRRRRIQLVGFSKSLALSEMQSYISRQDWRHALNLLPKLLEYPSEVEALVWRYIFIILLHTNDSSHLHRFFEQCIGSHNLNNSALLKKLLLLPLRENKVLC